MESSTEPSTSVPPCETTSVPEKAIQDLFQWFGKMATEYTTKVSSSESFDIIGKDLKTLYSKVESMIAQGQDTIKMNAQDIRKRTVEEIYQSIKLNIIMCRDVCKCVYQSNCISNPILEEVKKMLVDEGFEVNYVVSETSTSITIQW